MTLKIVENGFERDMTPEEEAAMLADWATNSGPVVPSEVFMYQARQALIDDGLKDDVDAAIEAMSEPAKSRARNAWEYRPTVQRDSELTIAIASILSLTSEQVDELFIRAATL